MCLIAVKPKNGALPLAEHLENGEAKNQDGMGICWWKAGEDKVHIRKDFKTIKGLINFINTNIKVEDALVVHFRKATSGLTDFGNRHPFPVTTDEKLIRKSKMVTDMAVAHNGVMGQFGNDKIFSDTAEFVLKILGQEPIKNNLENEGIQDLIGDFIGGDRLAIMTNDGEIDLFGEWKEEDDIYYSNVGYANPPYKAQVVTPATSWDTCYPVSRHQVGFSGVNQRNIAERNVWRAENEKNSIPSPSTEAEECCKNCGGKHSTKQMEYKKKIFMLCKACRRELGRKKISVEQLVDRGCMIGEKGNPNWSKKEEEQCDNCGYWFDPSKLAEACAGVKLCEKCIPEYAAMLG